MRKQCIIEFINNLWRNEGIQSECTRCAIHNVACRVLYDLNLGHLDGIPLSLPRIVIIFLLLAYICKTNMKMPINSVEFDLRLTILLSKCYDKKMVHVTS